MSEQPLDYEGMLVALWHSWEVHRQAFGPILEPAFTENPQARVLLINALNHISRREVERSTELLKQLRPLCATREDLAAWTFFTGVCFEMGGGQQQALEWYEKAEEIGHRFYLPYLKMAKALHTAAQFEKAKRYYHISIDCLLEMPVDEQREVILGSVYTNLTSCLTMLHQYPEAECAWEAAQQYPMRPGADSAAAILYAAMGNAEKTAGYIEKLKKEFPAWVSQTQETTQQILDGTHPAFPR